MVVVPLKEFPVETTKPVQPGVSASEAGQPYRALASTMEKSGEAADTIASSIAEQAGAQAVTRDANGDVQVQKALFVGPAAAHWERARKMAALVEYDGDAQRQDIALRTQFHNNPQGYLAAADQYARDMQAKVAKNAGPDIAVGVRRVIERTTTQTFRGLQNEFEQLDLHRSEATMSSGVKSATSDLTAMARGGITDPNNPDVKAAWDKYDTLQAARVGNPRLAYPQAQADYDREHLLGTLGAQGFLHHVDETYKNAPTKADGAKAATDFAQSILTDKSLKLTQQEREGYYHKGLGEVRANEALRKQDIGEARLASQSLQMAISLGIPVTPDEADGVIKMHEAAGDQAGAARLQAAIIRKGLPGDEFNKLPAAERTRQISALQGQAAAKSAYDFFTSRGYTPAQASGIVGNLIHESGLDPGAVGDAGTSVGLAQFHNERAVALAQFARERGTSPGEFRTQLEFIDKELRSTEGRAFGALQAATTPEAAAAAFVHYERPQGYDSNNLAAAHGYESRVAQAKAVFGGQGNVDTGTVVGSAWLSMSRAVALNKDAWAQWKQLKEDYKKEQIRPPDRVVNELRQSAYATGDSALLEDIAKTGDQVSAVEDAAQRSLPAQHAQIAKLHELGAQGQLDAGQQALVKDLERRNTAITEGLKDNPIATVVANFGDRFKTPAPLNVADPNEMAAGLAYRGKLAQFAAQNWRTGPVPALDKADLATVSAALQNPDPNVKAGVLQALTTALPEDVRGATLQKLGEQGHEQLVAVAAGGLMAAAPDIAKSILIGQKAKAAEKGYLPEASLEKTAYNGALDKALPASMFTLESRTNPTGAMTMIRGAVEARYAFLSAQAGDTKGAFVQGRMDQAVADITGGVLTHNGGNLIAPARGMPQARFDSLLYGLNERDLAGVTSPVGEPITPAYLRGRATLESVGDGRYGVLLGSNPDKPIYAYVGANTEMPQKFILDMRGRTNVGTPPEPSFPATGMQ